MEEIKKDEKAKIWNLYFAQMLSYEEIIKHFENKYTYQQIRRVIDEKYR